MKNKKVLAIIPARGGSKGIKNKNIINILGKPLISYVCNAAKKANCFDELILSSDNKKIITTAKKFGIDAPFIRPKELAKDETLVIEVISHALKWFEKKRKITFDYVCILQPTAPLAKKEDYEKAVKMAIENNADTVITTYKCGQLHPSIMYTREKSGKVDWFVKKLGWKAMSRRQDLPPIFMRSGIVYVFKSSMIINDKKLYGDKIFSIVVDEARGSVDINNSFDLKVAELSLLEIEKEKV